MKMKRKGVWIGLMAAFALGATALGGALSVETAGAENDAATGAATSVTVGGVSFDLSSFTTYEKAAIRLDTVDKGIRFTSGLDGEVYDKLVALDEENENVTVTFGTIITYYTRAKGAEAFTKEALENAYKDSLPEGATAYADCVAEKFLSETSRYKVNGDYAEFTAVLRVKEENYNAKLCARAYVSVVENDVESVYYANYTDSYRTPSGVANAALSDYAEYADNVAKLEILKTYVTDEADGFVPENEFVTPKAVDSTLETVDIGGRTGVTKFSQVDNANQWANRLETKFLSPSVTFGEESPTTAIERINAIGYRWMTVDFYYNDNFNVLIPTSEGHKTIRLQNGAVSLPDTVALDDWYDRFMVYDAEGNYTRALTKGNWYTAVVDVSAGVGVSALNAPQVSVVLLANNTVAYFDNVQYYCNDGWKTDLSVNDWSGSESAITLHAGNDGGAIGGLLYKGEAATGYEAQVADESVATYKEGVLTPLKAGRTTVTVRLNGSEYKLALNVTEAYVQAENAAMMSVFAGFAEGATTSYGLYEGTVGGRTGVYEMNGPDTGADWTNKLAVTETDHDLNTPKTAFANMREKEYAYITFDVYFSQASTGIYVYAPDAEGKHTYAIFVGGWDNTVQNDNISLTYNGIAYTKAQAGRWYTVVVKYVIPETQNNYASVSVNWRTGTGSVYFDNLKYWYNDSFATEETDYVQKDGSEFEYYSQSGTTAYTYVEQETYGRTGVYRYTSSTTDWNTRLVVKETNFGANGLGSVAAVNSNMTQLGYAYVTFDICLNATSTFCIASCTSEGQKNEKFTNNANNNANANVSVYGSDGKEVSTLENGVWYTIVVKYDWDNSNWNGITIGSVGSSLDMNVDNVRYYLNDSWKTDFNVA